METNAAIRTLATQGLGWQPSRYQDDQEIFWSLLTHLFDGFPRFERALNSKNVLNRYYASEVWEKIIGIIDPRDGPAAAKSVRDMNQILSEFNGDFETWSSEVHKLYYEMRQNGQAHSELVLCEQMKTAIQAWVKANLKDEGTFASKWDTWLCTDLERQLDNRGVNLNVDDMIDIRVLYERKIGGPGQASTQQAPTSNSDPGKSSAHPNLAYAAGFEAGQKDPMGQVPKTPPQYKMRRDQCTHCGKNNHDSRDCFTLPENASMWCDQCRTNTHKTERCRYIIADQRTHESGGRGRGRGRGAPKQMGYNGGAGPGRGQPKERRVIDCHICLENHPAGGCKLKEPINRFTQILVKQKRTPTAEEVQEFLSSLSVNNDTGNAAMMAQTIGRQIRDEIFNNGGGTSNGASNNGSSSSRFADASADIAMRAEMDQLRAQVMRQQQQLQTAFAAQYNFPDNCFPQTAYAAPNFPQLQLQSSRPRIEYRGETNLGAAGPGAQANVGNSTRATGHVQMGPQTAGRGTMPPPQGRCGIIFENQTQNQIVFEKSKKILPLKIFEDADESEAPPELKKKVPKPFEMIWPKMFLLRVIGYVLRIFFTEDEILSNVRREVESNGANSITKKDLRRIALVMCELDELDRENGIALNAVLKMKEDGNLWMVVDSGANRHYVSTEEFLCLVQTSVSTVYGVGDANVQTRSRGLMQGVLQARSGNRYSMSSQASCVPAASVSLFSVPMAVSQGHEVYFGDTSTDGACGMRLAGTDEWVPFTWDPKTGLWWLCVE